jgi:hypothetical protein
MRGKYGGRNHVSQVLLAGLPGDHLEARRSPGQSRFGSNALKFFVGQGISVIVVNHGLEGGN